MQGVRVFSSYEEFAVDHAHQSPEPKSASRWLREFLEAFIGGYCVCWFWLWLLEVLL